MRYMFRLVWLCALITTHVSCSVDVGDVFDGGCDPGLCEGVVCDDGNECTYEYCLCGRCSEPSNYDDGTECTFDSTAGVCVDGVCGENLCEDVVCDDGLDCTDDTCVYADGLCDFTNTCNDDDFCTRDVCDPTDGMCRFPPDEDGLNCTLGELHGICESGVCVGVCDPASEEVSECPILDPFQEGLLCCPGNEGCAIECN